MSTLENIENRFELTSSQKKKLRALGHHLEPVVYVGKEGLSKPLQQSAMAALKARELIKIKLGQNCPLERGSAGEQLAALCEAALVQVIGRMVLLYRPNPDLPAEKRIG
ncbi:MAG: ribosome assembly RNA-binding protein YhbY [Desulfobulbus sp.]|nr:ribosome assembly RNA-binding protein YhbY [Desulfobulbus sp.]